MPSGPISKRSVDALLHVKGKVEFLWDSGGRDSVNGFGVRVTEGAKAYVFQYRLGGRETKTRRITIGKHGPWTPETARQRAKELTRMVDSGMDPAEAEKERRRQAVDLAFASYVEAFAQGYLKQHWARWEAAERQLKRTPVQVLRRKPLPSIKRSDLNPIWDALSDRPAVARLTFATLRKLFKWAVDRGDIDRSPMEGLSAPPGASARDRVLSDREIALAWGAAESLGPPFANLYRLLIATGQRREEVAGLKWEELNRDLALWTLPGERAKNGETHLVPLSSLASAVLDEVAGLPKWPRRGLVFTVTGKTPVSGFSKAKARLDAAVAKLAAPEDVKPWRVHDIRRTVATGFQRLGVRFEVTEAVLNHVSGARSGVAGIYQRHDWQPEKRAALDKWALHVESALRPSDTG